MIGAPKTIPGTVPKRRKGSTERRSAERFTFSAVAEIMNAGSSISISARVSDISRAGCYLDVYNVLAAGAKIWITIQHGNQQFQSDATVVYSMPDMGMGIAFDSTEPEMLSLLDRWIAETKGEVPADESTPALHYGSAVNTFVERDFIRRLVGILVSKNIVTEDEGADLLNELHREAWLR